VPRSTNVEHYADILQDLKTKRNLVHFGQRVLDAVAGGDKSSTEMLADVDRQVLEMQQGYDGGHMQSLAETAPAILDKLQYRVDHRGQLTGVDTGFTSINNETNGWNAGDYVILGARPSIGKTTFAVNTMVAAARAGAKCAIFSMEMTRDQLEFRILSSLSNVPLTQLLRGYVPSAEAWTSLSASHALMSELSIEIDDSPARTAWDIRGAVRRMKAEKGLDLVVIDYVQLMPGTIDRRGATRNEELTDISRRLKILAGEAKVCIMLLSQLSRPDSSRADPRPRLQDLRDSGALEQDADLVCFLHRKNHREGGVTNLHHREAAERRDRHGQLDPGPRRRAVHRRRRGTAPAGEDGRRETPGQGRGHHPKPEARTCQLTTADRSFRMVARDGLHRHRSGRSGGLALLVADVVLATPMPDTERDICDLVEFWKRYGDRNKPGHGIHAALEHVWSTPGQGGAFKFGKSVGHLEMALTAARIPFDKVLPKAWQRALGVAYPARVHRHREEEHHKTSSAAAIPCVHADHACDCRRAADCGVLSASQRNEWPRRKPQPGNRQGSPWRRHAASQLENRASHPKPPAPGDAVRDRALRACQAWRTSRSSR
jgi:replicative DNA helicase